MWSHPFLAVVALAAAEVSAALPVPTAPSGSPNTLTVYPATVSLNGPRDLQRLVVVATYPDGRQWDFTRTATYAADAVVTVDAAGIVRPAKDGQGRVTIQAGGLTTTVPVEVKDAAADTFVDFNREVQPVLTKFGCNGGSCHGAQYGKGGFRLSLFGFDTPFDHEQITRSAEGRRIVVSEPERSILLQKPTLTMEHGGGEKFAVGSRPYETLRRWLADGAPPPGQELPFVTGIEVMPAKRLMVPGEKQQVIVTATWSDGRKEDVTDTAQFDPLNDSVADITGTGLLTAKGPGETHVMVRFLGAANITSVTLPFARPTETANLTANNFIDEKLIAKWKDLGLAPSPLAGDAEFFRRLHLDAIGTLPEPKAVLAFLADTDPKKREKAVDAVLARPEFVDFWTLKWGDLLRINSARLQDKGMWSFHNWVRAALRDGKPVDEFVRDIILAEGSTYTEGAANYFRIGNGAEDWAETTAQVFLGVRMQCAKCHHHPFEKWTQDDYYGMAAFFTRLGTKNSQEFGLFGGESIIFIRDTGDISNPRTRKLVKPHPLDGSEMDDPFDRRRKLAEWLTAKDNPFFSRNIVNRFWGYVMGRGLVEPLDDMRATNPASNPELLDALAKDFAERKFDLKHLLRTIFTSRAYQLSSDVVPGNAADAENVHFSRYTVKRLTAEQLADALDMATGTMEKYAGLPPGTRAIQLPDGKAKSYLMAVFGKPERRVACECERTTQPNIAQALHLLNGDIINKKLAESGRIRELLSKKVPAAKAVEDLYLATLSRPPRAEEMAKVNQWLAAAPTPQDGYQDLLWVLLNSREFLFNH